MRQKLRSHVTFANVVSLIALSVALGGTTYAATGGNFILGQGNSASSTTGLSAGTTGPALRVTNTSTGTAGSFNAAAGHPALAVNTTAKVSKLNADLLDGKDSTSFASTANYRQVGPVAITAPDQSSNGTTIATVGNFTFAGACFRDLGGPPMDTVVIDIQSAVGHSTFGTMTQAPAGGAGDMTQGTPYTVVQFTMPTGTPDFNPVSGSAVDPSGQEVIFNLYQGMNARNQPGECIFGGSFVVQ
jgi:hypothetical protein